MDKTIHWIKQSSLSFNSSENDITSSQYASGYGNTPRNCYPIIADKSDGSLYFTYIVGGKIPGTSTTTSNDIVVGKMDTSGTITWILQHRQLNPGNPVDPSIALGSDGVYICYSTTGTTSGNTTAGATDVAIAKLNKSTGALVWVKQLEWNTITNDFSSSIVVDSLNNIYASFTTSESPANIRIVKLDSSGNYVAQQSNITAAAANSEPLSEISATRIRTGSSLAIDANNNLYVSFLYQSLTQSYYRVAIANLATDTLSVVWINSSNAINTADNVWLPNIVVDNSSNIVCVQNSNKSITGAPAATGQDIIIFKLDSTGTLQWIRQPTQLASPISSTTGNGNDDFRASIAVDSTNNIYLTYQAEGDICGNNNNRIGYDAATDIIVAKLDTSGNVSSVLQSASLNTLGNNMAANITISKDDELYILYVTNGIISDVSASAGTQSLRIDPHSGYITTVATYDMTTNTVVWTHQDIYTTGVYMSYTVDSQTGGPPAVHKSVRDAYGNLYVLSATRLGNIIAADTYLADTGEPYLYKLDSSGKLLWILSDDMVNGIPMKTTSTSLSTGDIILDNDGNCIVSIRISGSVSGGTSVGNVDIYIMKVNTNGEILWVKQDNTFLTIAEDGRYGASLCVDPSNNIYLSGITRGTISGDSPNTYTNTPMIAKFNTNGITQWAKIVPQTSGASGDNKFATISTNGTHISLTFTITNTSITTDGANSSSTGNEDVVVCLFDMSGTQLWARQRATFNTTANETYAESSIDASGNVYVVYNTAGTTSGGSRWGANDIVVAKFDVSGDQLWSKQTNALNSSSNDEYPRMYNDLSNQKLYITYRASGSVSGGTLSGSTDIILVKMDYSGTIEFVKQNMPINTVYNEAFPQIIVSNNNAYFTYLTSGILTPEAYELPRSTTDIVIAKMGSVDVPTTASLAIPFIARMDNRVSNITQTSVSLNWSAPDGIVTGYRIYSDNMDGTDTLITSVLGKSPTSADITGLAQNTRYPFKVAAYNNAGEGKRTRIPAFVTSPAEPTNITISTSSTTSLISWTSDTVSSAPQYAIYDVSDNVSPRLIRYVSGTVNSVVIPNADITGTLAVQAVGNGTTKSTITTGSVTTPDPITSSSTAEEISSYIIANMQTDTSGIVNILTDISDNSKVTTVLATIANNRGAASSLSYMGPILSATSSYSLRERIGKAAMANLLTVANTSEGRFTAMKDALISLQGETSDTDVLTGIMTALSDYTNEVLPTIIALLTAARSAPSKKPIYFQKVREIATGLVSVPNDTLLSSFRATFTQGTDASSAFMTAASFDVLVPTSTTIAIDTTIVNVPTYLPILPDTQYTLTVGAASVLLSIASANGVLSINGTSVSLDQSVTIGTRVFRVDAIGTVAFTYTGPYVPPTPPTPPTDEGTVICFLGSAPVMTPTGYRKIYRMQAGDAVISADTGKTIVVTQVIARVHTASASTTPYVIEKGVFGATHTLYVSPNHKIYVAGRGMVEARDLGLPRASLTGEFTYYNIEVEGGDNITVGGVKVESLADVRRATISYNQFADMLCKKYGTGALTPATIANIKRTCVAVGPNHVSVPMMRRQSSAQSSRV